MVKTRLWGLFWGTLALGSPAAAQERPVRWSISAPVGELRVRAGAAFTATVSATIDDGWKLYSLNPTQGGPIATSIALGDSAFAIDSISAPKPESYPDRNFNVFTEIYTAQTGFNLAMHASASAKPGLRDVPILVRFQTCTTRYCLPPRTDTLALTVRVALPALRASGAEPAAPPTVARKPASPPASPLVVIVAPTDLSSLARFLWLAVTMGLLSLLTPCILPMIPITVAYFGGTDSSRGARSRAALAHAAGIVGAFSLLGLAVATLLGAGGVVRLAANPAVNLAIAALFCGFALNLAGVFEITLPQRLLTSASTLGSQRHAAGAWLMGAAFAATSFTCTVPFVGTLLVLASNGTWGWPFLGLATYGAAFAVPFVVIAFAPSMVQRLPHAGAWMLPLKRALAVAELALAIKFLSNADLVLGFGLLSRELVIGLWIVASLAIAVLWVPSLRAPGVRGRSTALAGVAAAAITAVWLVRGLRGERLGELDAYLPPRRAEPAGALAARSGRELSWILNDYDGALRRARAERRPLLLDFTGYTCTNCRWMEANMFPRPEIASQLGRYVRARLFTDGIGEPYTTQQQFQLDRFRTVALPYYVVLDSDGTPVATFLGMTRNVREFASFLNSAPNKPIGASR